MTVLHHEVRPGAYADSIVLMHLQSSLAALPGIEDAGVVMGTEANLELLAATDLLGTDLGTVHADDLILAVRAASEDAALAALAQVDSLLTSRRSEAGPEFRPHGLRSATRLLPSASTVLVSVPGRYAARVAHEALDHGKHVFLYSDNVSVADEVALKTRARDAGLLVMGPDCGTAILGGVGLGFANRVRRGGVGLVGASGTGLQAVTCAVHALGAGVSQAIGTGGRDLKQEVGAITTLQALDLLANDPSTEVIVLISKPPAPEVAERVLQAAGTAGKPVVVQFLGLTESLEAPDNVAFASSFDEAAGRAVAALGGDGPARSESVTEEETVEARSGDLRGLFAGGTLALEAQQVLSGLGTLHSNEPIAGAERVTDLTRSEGHTVLDLGADEFTVGRLHPMMDQELRIRRLRQEAADPATGVILMDVVLGDGSHPDPAAELAPAIEAARKEGGADVVVLVVGTDLDPQGLSDQVDRLHAAGARVFKRVGAGLTWVARRLGTAPAHPAAVASGRSSSSPDGAAAASSGQTVDPSTLAAPMAAISVGLDSFAASMTEQDASVVQLDWKPPAGGNEELMALLERVR